MSNYRIWRKTQSIYSDCGTFLGYLARIITKIEVGNTDGLKFVPVAFLLVQYPYPILCAVYLRYCG